MSLWPRCKYLKEVVLVAVTGLIILKLFLNITNDYGNEPAIHEATGIYSRQLQQNIQISGSYQNQVKPHHKKNISIENVYQVETGDDIYSSDDGKINKLPIDVLYIFTNSASNNVLQYHLRRAIGSLLTSASVPIRLHLITDDEGFNIASKIVREVQVRNQLDSTHLKIVFVSTVGLSEEVEPIVSILQKFFTNQKHSYYKDFLFFFSLFLDRLLPGLQNVILMDIDIKVRGDIAELYSHFSRFNESQVMGMAPELSPVYRHLLSLYRNAHPDTKLGSSFKSGGFPGYNSGVVLINIPKLRKSKIMNSYLQLDKLSERTTFYNFHGHLGDQDLYTLIALDHPELFYTLPCSWNRQLCQWWRNRGYEKVFDDYFECDGDTKIIHGNCKTEIAESFR